MPLDAEGGRGEFTSRSSARRPAARGTRALRPRCAAASVRQAAQMCQAHGARTKVDRELRGDRTGLTGGGASPDSFEDRQRPRSPRVLAPDPVRRTDAQTSCGRPVGPSPLELAPAGLDLQVAEQVRPRRVRVVEGDKERVWRPLEGETAHCLSVWLPTLAGIVPVWWAIL